LKWTLGESRVGRAKCARSPYLHRTFVGHFETGRNNFRLRRATLFSSPAAASAIGRFAVTTILSKSTSCLLSLAGIPEKNVKSACHSLARENSSMPISDKQLAANRANAKKSTGPKSAFGKAICALNGFAHGFTGLATVMTEEDRAAQTAFVTPYVADLKPVGPVEIQLAQTLALDNFRLNRIKTVEENMFAYGEVGPLRDEIDTEHARVHHAIVQARVFTLNDRAFNNLSLYEQRITRSIHKNMKLLFELQARRKSEERLTAKTQPLTRSASGGTDPNGFGFANPSGLRSGTLIRTEAGPEPPAAAEHTAPTVADAQEAPIAPPKAA
jgi:hypothetical protein